MSSRLPFFHVGLAFCLGVSATSIASAQCGLPLPSSGQTVTWTLSGSPYVICQDITIPPGGTVLVDPGVIVQLQGSSKLDLLGRLSATGTPTNRVTLQGPSSARVNVAGELELRYATLSAWVGQSSGSTLSLTDCDVTPAGNFQYNIPINAPMRARLERCSVQTSILSLTGQSALLDVTFTGDQIELRGYSLVRSLTSNAPLALYRDYQPMLVDDIAISGASTPALECRYSDAAGGTDFRIGGNVTLVGNEYPVQLVGSGLVGGSLLPITGNLHNVVLAAAENAVWDGEISWPEVGLPYLVTSTPEYSGFLRVDPGVEVRVGASGSIGLRGDAFHIGQGLRGLPGEPIRFVPDVPLAGWYALVGIGGFHQFEHLVIEGAGVGVSAPQALISLRDSEIRLCDEGLAPTSLGRIEARGVAFLSNSKGAVPDPSGLSGGGLDLDGFDRPNVFAGNGIAVTTAGSSHTDARANWWNHPSGPLEPNTNPTGLGDPVSSSVDFSGWLSALPDLSDQAPVVRMNRPFFLAEPGSRVILTWETSDDHAVASQTIYLDSKGGGAYDFQPVVTLPGGARSYEWTVPNVGFNTAARPSVLRIEAIDDAGNRSFDQASVHIPQNLPQGNVAFSNDLSSPFQPGEWLKICWTALGLPGGNLQTYLILDGDERRKRGPVGNGGIACTFSSLVMPQVSTDTARIAVRSDTNGNVDEWFFSPRFTIQPTALLGDQPPAVTLHSPAPGSTFLGGSVVPVSWSASDDEGIRSAFLQVSLDGGRTWNRITNDLPGNTTSYAWQLPASSGINDARLRVIVRDHRYQNRSDGSDGSFRILPGAAQTCQKNLGFGGPGGLVLSICGDALASGGSAKLDLVGGPPSSPGLLLVSTSNQPTAAFAGTLVPLPLLLSFPFITSATGELQLANVPGGGGPATLYVQALVADASQPVGVSISNALEMQLLP